LSFTKISAIPIPVVKSNILKYGLKYETHCCETSKLTTNILAIVAKGRINGLMSLIGVDKYVKEVQ
jgi:hypothetical protein